MRSATGVWQKNKGDTYRKFQRVLATYTGHLLLGGECGRGMWGIYSSIKYQTYGPQLSTSSSVVLVNTEMSLFSPIFLITKTKLILLSKN